MLRILVADDDEGDRKNLRRALSKAGFTTEIFEVETMRAALQACETHSFDCAFIDYLMPDGVSLDKLPELHALAPSMAIIMVTGQGDEAIACESIKRGAADYMAKRGISAESIRRTVERAIENTELSAKLRAQRKELESFTSILAHDLRAPLRSIRMIASMMRSDIDVGDFSDLDENLQRVDLLTNQMDALIVAIHAYTKIDRDAAFELVSADEILANCHVVLGDVISVKSAEVSSDALPEIWASEPLIGQLFQNLIANGVKYCEATPPKIHVSAELRGECAVFSIRDNGIGIAEQHRKRVFEPFERLHTRSEYEGSGIGLATCQKIVTRHNGEIWCESTPGEGSTFYFSLPLHADAT